MGRNLIEFEISFDICKKIVKDENENNSFLLKTNKMYV